MQFCSLLLFVRVIYLRFMCVFSLVLDIIRIIIITKTGHKEYGSVVAAHQCI